jgi:predicted nucleotidyltransferase
MRHPNFELLKTVFAQFPQNQAVYLFGSLASGRGRLDSDLDLAVISGHDRPSSEKLDILARLAQEGFCNVDLVFLPKDDIVLQYEAVRMNRIVYRRPEFDSAAFYSLVIRRYLDFVPYLDVQRKAYKERILHGQT